MIQTYPFLWPLIPAISNSYTHRELKVIDAKNATDMLAAEHEKKIQKKKGNINPKST